MRASFRTLFISGAALLALAAAAPRLSPWPLPDFVAGVLYGMAAGALLAALLRIALPEPCDTGTPALRQRYLREFLPPMAGYVIALLLSVWLLKRVDDPALRALIALLPVPPVALAMRAIMRYIRDADELQRRIEVEALAFATGCVSLGYLAAGLLAAAKVIEVPGSVAMIWVFPLVCLAYGIAKVAVSRRYS